MGLTSKCYWEATIVLALQLQVSSELNDAATARLTSDLFLDLRRTGGLEVESMSEVSGADSRSDSVALLGQFALTFLTSGAAVALINALKPIFERAPSTVIKIKAENGRSVEITSSQIANESILPLIQSLSPEHP
jgi:hypothetical protein